MFAHFIFMMCCFLVALGGFGDALPTLSWFGGNHWKRDEQISREITPSKNKSVKCEFPTSLDTYKKGLFLGLHFHLSFRTIIHNLRGWEFALQWIKRSKQSNQMSISHPWMGLVKPCLNKSIGHLSLVQASHFKMIFFVFCTSSPISKNL